MFKALKLIPLITVFIVINIYCAYGYEDGFGAARKIQGKNFTVFYSPALDPDQLSRQLDLTAANNMLAGKSITYSGNLAESLDVLFLNVCNLLDMNLYSYEGVIKVCRDQGHLSKVYSVIFGQELGERYSFYVFSLNTIYISAGSFNRYIVGHEMAHAVISHYFVVQPPVKVAEVLSGYVEYQLRKNR